VVKPSGPVVGGPTTLGVIWMAALDSRIARLEREKRFRDWLGFARFLEGLTDEQLDAYVHHGHPPEPLPEPLPIGACRLDRLDRKSLIKLWEEHEREFGDRSREELDFYCAHGHWLEQACDGPSCIKGKLEEMRRQEATGRGTVRLSRQHDPATGS